MLGEPGVPGTIYIDPPFRSHQAASQIYANRSLPLVHFRFFSAALRCRYKWDAIYRQSISQRRDGQHLRGPQAAARAEGLTCLTKCWCWGLNNGSKNSAYADLGIISNAAFRIMPNPLMSVTPFSFHSSLSTRTEP